MVQARRSGSEAADQTRSYAEFDIRGGQNKNEGNTEADGADHVRISLRIRPKHVCKILVCDVAKGPGKFKKLCGFGTRTRAGQVGRLRVKSCAVYSFTYS